MDRQGSPIIHIVPEYGPSQLRYWWSLYGPSWWRAELEWAELEMGRVNRIPLRQLVLDRDSWPSWATVFKMCQMFNKEYLINSIVLTIIVGCLLLLLICIDLTFCSHQVPICSVSANDGRSYFKPFYDELIKLTSLLLLSSLLLLYRHKYYKAQYSNTTAYQPLTINISSKPRSTRTHLQRGNIR